MRLRLVCINDVYTLENLPRLHSLVRRYATVDPADALLVTLAGDFLAPSMLSSLDAGRGMVDCMNAVGVTHATFGNHEDDIAIDELRRRIRELRAKWLATNVVGFEPPLATQDVIDVAGVRVGLLGVVMSDPAVYRHAAFGGAHVEEANAVAAREAARLRREERCALVIPLTHQPMDDDRALARKVRDPPFDVIVGGHEHEPFLERVEGTWIVKAGSDARRAVVVDIAWASGRERQTVTARFDEVLHYPEDLALRARVDVHMRRVHALEGATLLKLAPGEVLSSIGARARQTSLGTLLCSRIRDALGAEGCVFNGGGIRASREYATHFTYGDLKAEVPFDNEVVVARLPGRVVREAVVASRAHAPTESGGFLQVDDRLRVDTLDDAREYRIALVRELFDGMDHIEPLVRFAREHPEKIPPRGSGREVKMVLVDAFSVALWKQLGGFDAVDANHDGIVTSAEIAEAVARVTAEAPSSITGDLVVQALDANHDRLVTREEAESASVDTRGAKT
jgi:2',3'-cyclic-nucleotide 2'-phosphodiesterase (5'-nucleotidase family)